MPRTRDLGGRGPCPPPARRRRRRTCRGRAASAPCRPPRARGPSHPRAPRPAPAPPPRSGRAACGQGRGRAGASRGGAGGTASPGAPPAPGPGRAGPGLTYLRRISPPPWGSTWPGRARPRGRGGRATARRGRPRARRWRTASRGGGGQAARGSGWRIAHRPPGGPPPPPRPRREAPRATEGSPAGWARARRLPAASAPAPPLGPAPPRCPAPAPAPAPPRVWSARLGGLGSRACAAPARGLALPELAPPEPRESPPPPGSPRERSAAGAGRGGLAGDPGSGRRGCGGGRAGQVGGPGARGLRVHCLLLGPSRSPRAPWPESGQPEGGGGGGGCRFSDPSGGPTALPQQHPQKGPVGGVAWPRENRGGRARAPASRVSWKPEALEARVLPPTVGRGKFGGQQPQ